MVYIYVTQFEAGKVGAGMVMAREPFWPQFFGAGKVVAGMLVLFAIVNAIIIQRTIAII